MNSRNYPFDPLGMQVSWSGDPDIFVPLTIKEYWMTDSENLFLARRSGDNDRRGKAGTEMEKDAKPKE